MLCAFTGYTSFAFSDGCGKWLTAHYEVPQVLGINYLTASVVLLLLSPFLGGFRSLYDRATLKLQFWRGVFNFAASFMVVYSLSILPIASAYTMIFAAPFSAVLLGVLLYQEPLHKDRLIVLLLGFGGIVIAFQPWTNGFDTKLIVPLASSVMIALAFTTARSLKPETTIFSLGFTPMVVAFVIGLFFLVPVFEVPAWQHVPLIVLNGFFVCGGVVFVSQSFRMIAPDLASPFLYTEMVWALIFGWLIFADHPDPAMMLGAAVIIGCGYYLVRHEK